MGVYAFNEDKTKASLGAIKVFKEEIAFKRLPNITGSGSTSYQNNVFLKLDVGASVVNSWDDDDVIRVTFFSVGVGQNPSQYPDYIKSSPIGSFEIPAKSLKWCVSNNMESWATVDYIPRFESGFEMIMEHSFGWINTATSGNPTSLSIRIRCHLLSGTVPSSFSYNKGAVLVERYGAFE